MKVADLTAPELDYWVAKAENLGERMGRSSFGPIKVDGDLYGPSIDWSQGGPIIEREKIGLLAVRTIWYAEDGVYDWEKFARPSWMPSDERMKIVLAGITDA